MEQACDVLVVGSSTGGTAAAISAAESGARVILAAPTDWLGGQLTEQGVCTPDENRWIEQGGCTRRYASFRQAVRGHYLTHYQPTTAAAAEVHFNPGKCWVSALSFEPRIGEALLRQMLASSLQSGSLQILPRTVVTSIEMRGDTIHTVTARSPQGETRFRPAIVLDATDTGDLLPLCGTEGDDWVIGAESRAETGEPDAQDEPKPHWVQPMTFPFALDWSPESVASNRIDAPADYDALKRGQGWSRGDTFSGIFAGERSLWTYRRLLARSQFDDPRVPQDVSMINVPGNDYYGGNPLAHALGAPAPGPAEAAEITARARRCALGYLFWLQNECMRDPDADKGAAGERFGYPELRLRADLFGTADGLAPMPYIRESRRILAVRTLLQQELVERDFAGNLINAGEFAADMPDSVGIGHYCLDVHPNGHGEPNHYVKTARFQIPLGALLPQRIQNLIPSCKNIGTTHLSNGCYRLHPIEWAIGEAAGALGALCAASSTRPIDIYENPDRLRDFQTRLRDAGMPLNWDEALKAEA